MARDLRAGEPLRGRPPRLISAAPYRDRVIHHAIMGVVEPLADRSFIHDSYACRVGKGTHRALAACKRWVRRRRYVLKADIRHYFATLDHTILLELLGRRFRDRTLRECFAAILASHESGPEEYQPCGVDNLFSVLRPRGIPIGNLTSQFFANFYLDGLDHFVQEDLRWCGYLRYMDDFLLFGDDKRELAGARRAIAAWLEERRRLHLHPRKTRIVPVSAGVPFVGFRVFADRARLDARAGRRFVRQLRKLERLRATGEIPRARVQRAVDGWRGHAGHGSTAGLVARVLSDAGVRRVACRVQLWRGGDLLLPRGSDRPKMPGGARGLVEQQQQLALREPQQQQPEQSQQQYRFSLCENPLSRSRAVRGPSGRAPDGSDRFPAEGPVRGRSAASGSDASLAVASGLRRRPPRPNREAPRRPVGRGPKVGGGPRFKTAVRSVCVAGHAAGGNRHHHKSFLIPKTENH